MEGKPFPVFECPPDKKTKSGGKALQRGRDQMSMTCPIRQLSIIRWPDAQFVSISGLLWPCKVSYTAVNLLVCPARSST